MRNPILLVWRWTTSRARNSYGWNICTLYADGEKVGSTCGGNYDMMGTAFGEFLENTYHDRLLKLHHRAGSRYSISPSGEYKRLTTKKAHRWSNHGELYGLTAYYKRGEKKPFKIFNISAKGPDNNNCKLIVNFDHSLFSSLASSFNLTCICILLILSHSSSYL